MREVHSLTFIVGIDMPVVCYCGLPYQSADEQYPERRIFSQFDHWCKNDQIEIKNNQIKFD